MGKIRKKKLAEEIIEEIKRMIQDGELKEGDKLPNQPDFAEQLGVSRTSLREALATLVTHGALEQKQGMGTIVKSRFPALYADQLIPPQVNGEIATSDLIEARTIIEVGAVELAIQNATDEQIDGMGVLVEEMEKAIKEGRTNDYIDKDVSFHFLVAKATQNQVLPYLLMIIRGPMEKIIRDGFMSLPDHLKDSITEHRGIYQAIKTRDRKEAIAHVKKHLQFIADGVKERYKIEANKD